MAEWTVTISLFEFDEHCHARPIMGVSIARHGHHVHGGEGPGCHQDTPQPRGRRQAREGHAVDHCDAGWLRGQLRHVVCAEESKRALSAVASIAGKPADIKRVGPASMDLCKVADGTYDAYFEPHLHKWDVPAVSAARRGMGGAGRLRQWNGELIHWRRENDVVASNG